MAFELGDIFVTRNFNEDDNNMPGYWNHVAIWTTNGVVEAQLPPWNSVICSVPEEFLKRYADYEVYRYNRESDKHLLIGEKAAMAAVALIGRPYQFLASLFPRLKHRRGENCVSVIRKSYKDATGVDPGWKIPDDVTSDGNLTKVEIISNRV
jgi:uncharacterized protein YycO